MTPMGMYFQNGQSVFNRTSTSESNSKDPNTIQLLYCRNIHE